WGALEAGLTDACRAGARELVSLWGHPDQTEGPLAFTERRETRWVPPAGPTRDADAGADADGDDDDADADAGAAP
ncbi:MAG TPA: hypothetical protein VF743_11520, partial [Acidimicrobiales bacterium]